MMILNCNSAKQCKINAKQPVICTYVHDTYHIANKTFVLENIFRKRELKVLEINLI